MPPQKPVGPLRTFLRKLATLVFGLFLSIPGLVRAQYSFSTIDVPVAGAKAREINGNSTHEIVGEFEDASGIIHGFILEKRAFTTIDVPGTVSPNGKVAFTSLNGLNAQGRFVGTYSDGATNHAFVANKGDFTTLDPPGSSYSQGGFINAQGEVVGAYRDHNAKHPDQVDKRRGFVWRNGIFTPVNVPGDHPLCGTVAFGINDIDQVVENYV